MLKKYIYPDFGLGFFMATNFKYNLILQANVLLWGLTGILGDYIHFEPSSDILSTGTSESFKIVFYRTAIATISMIIIGLFVRKSKSLKLKDILILLSVGVIIAGHWFSFFYSIKVSTVSIAVVCMATMAVFMAIIEPIVNKRRVYPSEIVLSVFSLAGMTLIFGFESQYIWGIIWGLITSLLSAIFTVINSKLTHRYSTISITKFEMMGAMLVVFIVLLFSGEVHPSLVKLDASTWMYVMILGLLCTTLAFLIGVWVIKYVSPFTFGISINLEPVYTILIVLLIDYLNNSSNESMTPQFYAGGGIIVLAVFLNAYLKNRESKSA